MTNTISNIVLKKTNLHNHMDWNCLPNSSNEDFVYVGWISRYEYQRGFGLVVDLINNEEHFFHISDVGTDLFSCNNNKIKELVLSHLLDELRYSFQKSERFKRLKSECANHGLKEIDVSVSSKFGRYKVCVDEKLSYALIKDHSLNNYPYLHYAQIICFKLKEDKAVEIHTPNYFVLELLKNKHVYPNNLWNLLFRFVPDILFSIEYNGPDHIDDVICSFKQKSNHIVDYVKQFDIEPYRKLDNYTLSTEFSYYPTVKDSDPNQLYLVIIRNSELKDKHIGYPKIEIPLTPLFDYYGQAPHHYYMSELYDEYKEKYQNYYNEYKESNGQIEKNSLLNKYFHQEKIKWIEYYTSSYSRIEHLKQLLWELKNEYLSSIEKSIFFSIKKIYPDFYKSSNKYVFEYDDYSHFYGYKIELIHKNDHYQLFTYDRSYNGRYKGKHYIGNSYFNDNNTFYSWSCIERDLNKELHLYLCSLFDNAIEQIVSESGLTEK